MRILIIANARFKGGLSGGDAIYESFVKYWPCSFRVWSFDIEYKPFFLAYLQRICLSCFMAIIEPVKYDVVYSSSDFLPDALAGFIFKLKGSKWVAGFYLKAFKENPIHFWTQKIVRWLIDKFADMVIVTNPTMYDIFPNKKKTWINGGIDLKLAGISDKPKIYDAVFCGRIHPTKGIDELIEIWKLVREKKPNARLALIGDGDLGLDYIRQKLFPKRSFQYGIDLLGYMGNERFEIYKQSKVVLYPTPLKYDHFSMAPVEAMACGCHLVMFDNPVSVKMAYDFNLMAFRGDSINKLAEGILYITQSNMGANRSIESAQQFDYQKQSLRVYNDLRKELF